MREYIFVCVNGRGVRQNMFKTTQSEMLGMNAISELDKAELMGMPVDAAFIDASGDVWIRTA